MFKPRSTDTANQRSVTSAHWTIRGRAVGTGQTAHLAITLRKRNASGLAVVGVVSTLGAPSDVWPIAVVMR